MANRQEVEYLKSAVKKLDGAGAGAAPKAAGAAPADLGPLADRLTKLEQDQQKSRGDIASLTSAVDTLSAELIAASAEIRANKEANEKFAKVLYMLNQKISGK